MDVILIFLFGVLFGTAAGFDLSGWLRRRRDWKRVREMETMAEEKYQREAEQTSAAEEEFPSWIPG